jgi:thiol-disulfide isomerase/thioredoxin
MRIVPCIVVLAFLCCCSTGCQLSNKKDGSGASGGSGPFLGAGSGSGEKPKLAPTSDPLAGAAVSGADLEGLLAGRVIDARTGQPADAQIHYVCLDDPKAEEAPIDVAVNAQGYFMIQGLKSGKQYKLIARTKNGERLMTGVSITRVPNVHMLIRVSEDFSVPNPGKANGDKGTKKAANSGESPTSVQIQGWQSPTYPQGPPTLPPPSYGADASKIAGKDTIKLPTMEWKAPPLPPAPKSWQTPPPVKITPPVPPPLSTAPGQTPVPSCVLVGKKLENFALLDISLTPWEYRTSKRGKVILLDFWMPTCVPCRDAVYTLNMLQNKYGYGLDVVGIAYEEGTPAEQANKVTKTALLWHTNYQLLLGGGRTCPVKRDFRVQRFPTLVLIDESGMIVWQHEGGLDRSHIEDLDFAIKQRVMK